MKPFALLLVLFSATGALAQTSAVIKLEFPPMPVQRVRLGLFLTAKEPCTGTITLDNGSVLSVMHNDIPETFIRGVGLRRTVDACVATGTIEGGGTIIIRLPIEPVRRRRGVMIALAINADIEIVLADGKKMYGTALFPDCPTIRVGFGAYVATAITMTGTATIK
jgi:hypothetical protein